MSSALESLGGPTPAAPRLQTPAPNGPVVALALGLLVGGGMLLFGLIGGRTALLYGIGGLLGLVLYHAAFGFTGAWREFLADGRGRGLRAQMLMLALATVLMLPPIAQGHLFGQPVVGTIAPVGVSVLVGAIAFGFGMQLGGGCASGTLYTVGGGSTRMVVTLAFFCVGSLIGTAHLPWWLELPSLGSISLSRELGVFGAIAAQWAAFAAVALATVAVERRRHGALLSEAVPAIHGWRRALHGPWPLVAGDIGLALLNLATLAVAGHPWTVSFGYTLWGAKAAAAAGIDVDTWSFWTWPGPQRALQGSLFADTTSVMKFGIIVGAFLAAGLAGRFSPQRRVAWRPVAAAAIGGVLMGYGARLAFGCNVGAYFSGIASGSLHGWLWFVAGLAGSVAGTWLRPAFGLGIEARARAAR